MVTALAAILSPIGPLIILKFQKDLLVISCDLITDISIRSLYNHHQTHSSSLTCVMRRKTKLDGPVPGMKSKTTDDGEVLDTSGCI